MARTNHLIGRQSNSNTAMSHSSEQKTIAKNTIFLYIRMIVVMCVSLYTSRVVLDKLGVDDYGIYNIVGSVVVSLSFVSNSLTNAMRRFFSYEIGKKDGACSNIFTMNFKIQLIIIVILLALLETVGLWFFETVIKIPEGRRAAASIVYQFSVATFCMNLFQVPYSSLIVARERMSIFAVFSIIDVVLKLAIVYMINSSIEADRLIMYGILIMGVSIIMTINHYVYCKVRLYKDSRVTKYWNKQQFKEIFSFASWNLIGGVTTVGTTEVPNYFMNYYLGVAVNAAMGVAKQVSNAVYTFSSNFQTAFNPQIIKSYASGEKDYLLELVFRASKLSFFLVYIIAIPFFLCCGEVLNMWLTVVPTYTGAFCVCIIIAEVIHATSSPLWMTAFAVGNIKVYQLVMCAINLTVIPAAWLVLSLGFAPYLILVYKILVSIFIMVYRIHYLKKRIGFPALRYYTNIVFRLLILIPALTVPVLYWFSTYYSGAVKLLVVSAVSLVFITGLFYLLGLDMQERLYIHSFIRKKLGRP